MAKQVEKRLDDLEKKAIPEGDYQVIVDWSPDPKPPKDKNVKVVKWDNDDDEIIETT